MDSGAADLATADLNNLNLRSDYKGRGKLTADNGSSLSISRVGSSVMNSSSQPLLLNILCVPRITKNHISVSRFTRDNNVIVEFFSNCLLVKDKTTRKVLLKGTLKDGLYQLAAKVTSKCCCFLLFFRQNKYCLEMYYFHC